ncbi:MAG: type II CRISPR-associated endonuclease Cas1 [Acetobacteraceae bacterium]
MAWRGLHIAQPSRLSLADGQMVVAQSDGEVRLALEDVAWVVIDTPQATLTTALIAACMDAGTVLVTTDAKHTPSGILLPFHRHHRQSDVAALQISASAPLRKRLWQAIVRAKITNQASALARCGGDAHPLESMLRQVGSGDPGNVEARAARHYWGRLFPAFVRERAGDKRNMLLNYGYAVARAAVARAAVASGLLPALGLNHASVSNAFNLADDLVEPFRPFVDVLVWEMSDRGQEAGGETTVEERRRLASVLLAPARLGIEAVTLLVATERTAASLVRALEEKRFDRLEMPLLAATGS